ncbi:MAG: lysophospholipid acyltransferase family protein [Planctomycetota bacterium]|jgi:1-acyl-sn-glycerol-3-phosphate acyltransferase
MNFLQFARRCPGRPALAVLIGWSWCKNACLIYMSVFHRLRRSGRANVPAEGPLIYVSNHQAHFDPMTVGVEICDRPFSAMARSTLFSPRPVGAFLRFLGAIPIDRDKSDLVAMKALIAELKAGRCVLVFPEGTRSPDGLTKAFKKGALLLIRRADARVIPCAVEGAHELWPKTSTLPKLGGHVAMKVGTPIERDEVLKHDDPLAFLRRHIETMRLELRAEIRRRSNGAWPPPGLADKPYWDYPELDEETDEEGA